MQRIWIGLACGAALTCFAGASMASEADTELCPQEGQLRSLNGNTAVNVTFSNRSNAERDLYWLGYDGKRVFYAKVAPGQDFGMSTYKTHPWVVTDSTGSCVGVYVAGQQGDDVTLR